MHGLLLFLAQYGSSIIILAALCGLGWQQLNETEGGLRRFYESHFGKGTSKGNGDIPRE